MPFSDSALTTDNHDTYCLHALLGTGCRHVAVSNPDGIWAVKPLRSVRNTPIHAESNQTSLCAARENT